MASKLNSSWNIRGFSINFHYTHTPPPSSCFFLVKTYELSLKLVSHKLVKSYTRPCLPWTYNTWTISNKAENYNKGKVGEHPSSLGTRKVNFFLKLFLLCNGAWKITNPQAFEVSFG
jgi:hypothetical protein